MPGQVDGRLGVAAADQHAALAVAQREDVAGPGDLPRLGRRVGQHPRGVRPVGGARCRCVTPSRASTEIVYAVRSLSLLCGVISGISSRSSMSAGIGTQITPLEWRIVNAISSGVALAAAKMMSPSFSRSSSSTTTTALPAAMSAIASLDAVEADRSPGAVGHGAPCVRST